MIFDALLTLSGSISASGTMTGQSVTGAGAVLGTNTIDMAPPMLGGVSTPTDWGAGEPIEVSFSVLAAPTVGTSVQFQLIQADDPALATNVQVIVQTDAIPIASLPAGTLVPLHYDRVAPFLPKRYVGVRYVNVGAIASMTVFASLVKNLQDTNNVFRSGWSML